MISLTRSAARYVSKLSNKLRRKMDMLSSRKEFSGSQGRALHFLLAQTEDVFQKDIEEEYSIRPSTATELLKQMEKNGLILRLQDRGSKHQKQGKSQCRYTDDPVLFHTINI